MPIHVFDRGDPEAHRWSHVAPGDLIRSPGALAWTLQRLLSGEYTGTVLGHHWLLVLARLTGVPLRGYREDLTEGGLTTFVVLSRHGLLYLLQKPRRDEHHEHPEDVSQQAVRDAGLGRPRR